MRIGSRNIGYGHYLLALYVVWTYHVVTTASVGSEKHTGQADVSGFVVGLGGVDWSWVCYVGVVWGFVRVPVGFVI